MFTYTFAVFLDIWIILFKHWILYNMYSKVQKFSSWRNHYICNHLMNHHNISKLNHIIYNRATSRHSYLNHLIYIRATSCHIISWLNHIICIQGTSRRITSSGKNLHEYVSTFSIDVISLHYISMVGQILMNGIVWVVSQFQSSLCCRVCVRK